MNVLFIHQQNINILMKEIYKFENDLSLPLTDDMFQVCKTSYKLRHFQKIENSKKKLCKNRSRDNILPCTSIMELSSSRDWRYSGYINIQRENKIMVLWQLSMYVMQNIHSQCRFCVTDILQNLAQDINLFNSILSI